MPALQPGQTIVGLGSPNMMNPIPEVTKIDCLADAGAYEVATFAFSNFAGTAQADYFHLTNKTGTKFAIWLDKDANGTAPSGAVYTAAGQKIKAGIATGDTGIAIAAKVKTAIELDGDWDEFAIVNNGNGSLTITSTLLGNLTNAATYKEDDSDSGSIGSYIVSGVASNLQNKYFVLRNTAGTVFNPWMNVSGEGVDPNPAGTEIACAVTNGGSAEAIAAQLATAINANANFKAWVQAGSLYVANEANGAAVDASAGNSGFTVTKIQDGKAGWFYPAMSPASLLVSPALVS